MKIDNLAMLRGTHYCEVCANDNNLPWDAPASFAGTCCICQNFKGCNKYTNFLVESGPHEYIDPIYKMYEGDYIYLRDLYFVDVIKCNYRSLYMHFPLRLRTSESGFSEGRHFVNNEIITVALTKGTETLIKLVDGGQISIEAATDNNLNPYKVFAVKVFEEERQKLITAWKEYKKFMFNLRWGDVINKKTVIKESGICG